MVVRLITQSHVVIMVVESSTFPQDQLNPRRYISSDVHCSLLTSEFLERADAHVYAQPGLTPEYWYQFRQSNGNVSNITDLPEREWILDTYYDPIESEIWLEDWNSTTYTRLYGISEGNFWDYFNKEWSSGDQIRISDGMLFTTLLQHLNYLKGEAIVGSMVMVDYDQEPHSTDTYGSVITNKQPTENPTATQKKKKRKKQGNSTFDWREPYIRKYKYKIYFLTEYEKYTSIDDDVTHLTAEYTDDEEIKLVNKLRNAFLMQRHRGSRSYNRTTFAAELMRRKKDQTKKNKSKGKRHTKRSPSPQQTHNKRMQSSSYMSQSKTDRQYKLHGTISGASQPSDADPNINIIETIPPHFYYNRVDEDSACYEYLNSWEEEPERKVEETKPANRESFSLTELIKDRQQRRKLLETSGNKTCLNNVKEKAKLNGISVDSYFDEVCTKPLQKTNHPPFPPVKTREQFQLKKISNNISQPSIGECRNKRFMYDTKEQVPLKIGLPGKPPAGSSHSGTTLGVDGSSVRVVSEHLEPLATRSILKTLSTSKPAELPTSTTTMYRDHHNRRGSLQALHGSALSLPRRTRISVSMRHRTEVVSSTEKSPPGKMEPFPVKALFNWQLNKLTEVPSHKVQPSHFTKLNSIDNDEGGMAPPTLMKKASEHGLRLPMPKKNVTLRIGSKTVSLSANPLTPKLPVKADSSKSQFRKNLEAWKLHSLKAFEKNSQDARLRSLGEHSKDRQKQVYGKKFDLPIALEHIDSRSFKGRYNQKDFVQNLLAALRMYKFTLETVVSSRGYSVSSIAISKYNPHSRISKYKNVNIKQPSEHM